MLIAITERSMHKIHNAENENELIDALGGAAVRKIALSCRPAGARDHRDLLDVAHEAQLLGQPHVAEIYSPPRVAPFVHR